MDKIILQKNKCLKMIDILLELIEQEDNPVEDFNNLSKVSLGIGLLEIETKKHLALCVESL